MRRVNTPIYENGRIISSNYGGHDTYVACSLYHIHIQITYINFSLIEAVLSENQCTNACINFNRKTEMPREISNNFVQWSSESTASSELKLIYVI